MQSWKDFETANYWEAWMIVISMRQFVTSDFGEAIEAMFYKCFVC